MYNFHYARGVHRTLGGGVGWIRGVGHAGGTQGPSEFALQQEEE